MRTAAVPATTELMKRFPGRRAAFAALATLGSVVAAAVALLGCRPGAAPFNNVDITGAPYAQNFSLTDTSGARRTLADFRGKVVVVFFGYTQCPDICPTTMSDLANVKQKLGPAGGALQVIFITLDPERDPRQVLAEYVGHFDPGFVALSGTADETAQTARDFKGYIQKGPGQTPTPYSLDHTAGSFVFAKAGKIRLFLRHGGDVEPIMADLKRLV